ncbi:hypothetical protein Pcinc_016870 [Petrolisthes cinctipes]|uniref:Uncharacterized protein n=1 Tax=Petrolisthes cinctipes TaxID=88211 RepID=A0AAE1KPC2_PETCI|nr:hypothetical protein Pcinc_016870 [Petrolisthes cinctipes]
MDLKPPTDPSTTPRAPVVVYSRGRSREASLDNARHTRPREGPAHLQEGPARLQEGPARLQEGPTRLHCPTRPQEGPQHQDMPRWSPGSSSAQRNMGSFPTYKTVPSTSVALGVGLTFSPAPPALSSVPKPQPAPGPMKLSVSRP